MGNPKGSTGMERHCGNRNGEGTQQDGQRPGFRREAKTREKFQVTGVAKGHLRTRMRVLCCVLLSLNEFSSHTIAVSNPPAPAESPESYMQVVF